jgi:large subunit ribosomal protein L24e
MVVKTETCAFTGVKIYPGHGRTYVRIDSRRFILGSSKGASSFLAKRNPRKLPWTSFYRRLHKKGTQEELSKKRNNRKKTAVAKAYVGASVDMLKAKRNQKPEQRLAAREAALREVKQRNQEKKAAKPSAAKGPKAAAPKAKAAAAPKQKIAKGGKR